MLTDYNRQMDQYEAYRQSVLHAPPLLQLSDAPANVHGLFAPFEQFARALIEKQTVHNVSDSSHSPQDEADRYYAERLVFGINSDTSINAFADYSPHGHYIISINAGLLAAMTMIFNRLFTHPSIFPKIGPASSDLPAGETHPIDYSIDDLHSFLARMPRPKPRSRADVADLCAVLATLFTVYHELRHVFGGHLDFERREGRATRLSEVEEGTCSIRPADVSRVLEFDADRAAILEIAHCALSIPPVAPAYGVAFNGALCAFALTTLFFVFDHRRTDVPSCARENYPHPEVRAFFAQTAIIAETHFATMTEMPWGIPQLASVTSEESRELVKEATRHGIAVNHLLARRHSKESIGADPHGLLDVFPDTSMIKSQLGTLQSGFQSLEQELREARAWARAKA